MKNLKKFVKDVIADESGQGTTEYILMLVVVVGIALAFKDQIASIVQSKMQELGGTISGFTSQ